MIRAVDAHEEYVFLSHSSGVNEELYDSAFVRYNGDVNKVWSSNHEYERVYQDAIKVNLEDFNKSEFYSTELTPGLSGLEAHLEDNLYLFTPDLNEYRDSAYSLFYVCAVQFD